MSKRKIIDKETVSQIARLSRIQIAEKEIARYQKELETILEYINKLNEVDSRDTPPTSHPLGGIQNVFRKDIQRQSLSQEEALQNAPSRHENFFSVPKIID